MGVNTCDDISAGGGWENDFIPQAVGRAEILFYATPLSSGGPIDAVVGFSDGPAGYFSDLGPIVRFNPQGFVDARNGRTYEAATSFAYHAGTTYQVLLEIDVTARTYDVYISEAGAPERQLIGQHFAFRSEQALVTRLDNVGRKVDSASGALDICQFNPIVFNTGRLSNPGSGWNGVTFPSQTGHFVAELSAIKYTLDNQTIDAVVGLANGMPSYFADLAAIVRFNPAGYFDVRDGDTYRYDALHMWTGDSYVFTFDVDVAAKRYSVTARVNAQGSPAFTLATNYRFRTEQKDVSSLDTLGQIVDSSQGQLWTEQLKVSY